MDQLLTDALDIDVSPGMGYLSNSDEDRCEPIENTIQLAWQPSFAEEYKRLLNEGDAEDAELSNTGEELFDEVQVVSCAVFRKATQHCSVQTIETFHKF